MANAQHPQTVSCADQRLGRSSVGPVAAAMLFALLNTADAETVTLRVHTFNSPKAIAVRSFLVPWARELEERTGGRVRVQVFPSKQLGGKASDLYGQARDGVVDIVWTSPGYSPGRFPLTEVFELPFVCADAEATSQAMMEFYRKRMQGEYRDTVPLVFHAAAPAHIHTTVRPVRRLEDIAGLKIRVPSPASAATIEALGAVPVGIPVSDVYEALSRGVVGGVWVAWSIMQPFRLHEVTRTPYRGFAGLCAVRIDDEQGPVPGLAGGSQKRHRRVHGNVAGQTAGPAVAGR